MLFLLKEFDTGITTIPNKLTKIIYLKGKKTQSICLAREELLLLLKFSLVLQVTMIQPLIIISLEWRIPIYKVNLHLRSIVISLEGSRETFLVVSPFYKTYASY